LYLFCIGGGEPLGKHPLGRPRRRSKVNFKKDVRQVGCKDGRRMKMAQDRVQ
jgi:hypothetical protein